MTGKQKSSNRSRISTAIQDLAKDRIRAYFNDIQSPIKRHAHPHFELLYIIKGVREVNLGGRHFTARAGDILIFRPNDYHEEYAGTKTISFFCFRFRPDELNEARLEFPRLDILGPVISLPWQEEFYGLFSQMMDEKNHGGEGSQLLLGAYLVEFVVKLRRAVSQVLSQKADNGRDSIQIRIRNAMDLIQKNISSEMDLKKIARSVFMSASRFSHVFKERTGESPKHYLIRERVEKAKELLVHTELTALEIAEQLGYESPYYFYRQFRRKTGLTAGQYRLRFRHPAKKCI
jgi:AraC-like DNA-binding protein